MSHISEVTDRIKNGSSTAVSEVEAALERIEKINSHNAVLSTIKDRALRRAKDIDDKLAKGENAGKLAGVTFIAKDNFLTFESKTTAASKMLENFVAPLQATAIEKLEVEGAICVAKANLDAFAHGGSTENSYFGPTTNAHDESKVAGGSSGGSAVVTALDVVPFALGTDTGGSIRQPAAFNGVIGVKPTYGTVSRYGVVAMASSTDTIGCFTKDVVDAELVMSIMSGKDDRDMTTLPDFFVPEASAKPAQKIGLIKEFMSDAVDPEVREHILGYIDKLRTAGHTVEEIDMPIAKYALAMYYIIVPAEVSSNLARYDGIRYGHRAENVKSLAELYGQTRDEGFMTENKRRIMIGSYVLSSGYFDAYYQKAQKARTLLINSYNELFQTFDALICPVTPGVAFGIGENVNDPVKMYLEDVMNVPPSLAGLPALSVPAGTSKNGLPIGAQLIGPRRSDAKLLALAREMESK